MAKGKTVAPLDATGVATRPASKTRRARQPPEYSLQQQHEIRSILLGTRSLDATDGKHRAKPPGRCLYLLRRFPKMIPSARAQLFYLHVVSLMTEKEAPVGGDPERQHWACSYGDATLAEWLDCDERTIRRVRRQVQGLTGWLPLLKVRVGKRGRQSSYTFVFDPFTEQALQLTDAERTRKRRHERLLARQVAATKAYQAGEIDAAEYDRRLGVLGRQRNWRLPPTPVPVDPPTPPPEPHPPAHEAVNVAESVRESVAEPEPEPTPAPGGEVHSWVAAARAQLADNDAFEQSIAHLPNAKQREARALRQAQRRHAWSSRGGTGGAS